MFVLRNPGPDRRAVAAAVAACATTYSDPKDYGFMYGHGFQDLDGHIWELMYIEPGPASWDTGNRIGVRSTRALDEGQWIEGTQVLAPPPLASLGPFPAGGESVTVDLDADHGRWFFTKGRLS